MKKREPNLHPDILEFHMKRAYPEIYGEAEIGPDTCLHCGMDKVHHPKCTETKEK